MWHCGVAHRRGGVSCALVLMGVSTILAYVRTSLTNSLNPKSSLIWRVNPQNITPIDSLSYCSLAENCFLMNSNSLG